jgi:hypothetical protein
MDINSKKQVEDATQGQGNFIDVKDGEKIRLRIVSGIKGIKEHSLEIKGKYRTIICPVEMEKWEAATEDRPANKGIKCPACEAGQRKIVTQFLAIAVDEKGKVGVLKKGATVFKPITSLVEEGYVLSERPVVIERKGTGLESEYSVIAAMKDQPLSDEEKAAVADFQKDYDLDQRSQPMSYDNIVRKLNGEEPIFDEQKADKLPD